MKARKKRSLKVVLISILALIAVLVTAIFILWHFSWRPTFRFSDNLGSNAIAHETLPDKTGFAADALLLVKTIEEVHPIFATDDWLSADYFEIRNEFLAYSQNPDITRTDFAFAATRYITTLRDGHMNMTLLKETDDGQWLRAIFGGRADISWLIQDEHLFLLDEGGALTETLVTEIGGVPTNTILSIAERYFYPENEADRIRMLSDISRLGDIIARAGGDTSGNAVTIALYEGGQESTVQVPMLSIEEIVAATPTFDFIIRYEMFDDIFFIHLRSFVNGDHITEVVHSIEQAIEDGIRKFIVDLRGNGGGASIAGQRLLEAMGITIPRFGAIRRISDLVAETHGGILPLLNFVGVDSLRFNSTTSTASNPNDVFISVLTDHFSYSSATMMGVWVQDGGFGNIIGSPSSNSPTNFGDWGGSLDLPYSRTYVSFISFTRWLRPDEDADPVTLWPDIMVSPGEDALDAALEFLRNLER